MATFITAVIYLALRSFATVNLFDVTDPYIHNLVVGVIILNNIMNLLFVGMTAHQGYKDRKTGFVALLVRYSYRTLSIIFGIALIATGWYASGLFELFTLVVIIMTPTKAEYDIKMAQKAAEKAAR